MSYACLIGIGRLPVADAKVVEARRVGESLDDEGLGEEVLDWTRVVQFPGIVMVLESEGSRWSAGQLRKGRMEIWI